LVVDDASGVANIGVGAFQAPVLGHMTDVSQAADFGAFALAPVVSGALRRPKV